MAPAVKEASPGPKPRPRALDHTPACKVRPKKPRDGARGHRPVCDVVPEDSGPANARSLQSLRAASHVELHGLALGERLETVALNRREMDENVLAAFLGNETKALRLVEPLHRTTSHLKLLLTW